MKKFIFVLPLFLTFLTIPFYGRGDELNLAEKLSGKILLQVESLGEAWYVNPTDAKKYYLGRPADAFALMSRLGKGITDTDLEKISVGFLEFGQDDDTDGLNNALENALGTDYKNKDTDKDGYGDKVELESNFNPLGPGKLNIDQTFSQQHAGKIFLQIQRNGEAWYINPNDKKRYFLSRPDEAFLIMKKFGLGITNENLDKITIGSLNPATTPISQSNPLLSAGEAIRRNDADAAVSYFVPSLEKSIRHTMNFLTDENRLNLGNILSGATLANSNSDEQNYSTEIYFSLGGYKVPVNFQVKKQADGKWLIANL